VYIVCSLSVSLPGLANKDVHKNTEFEQALHYTNGCYIARMLIFDLCPSAKVEKTCCDDSRVTVFADGYCVWFQDYGTSVSHCDIDIRWFPFDNQVCDLIFESRTYEIDQLNISRFSPVVELDSYSSNGEWDLIGKTSRFTVAYSKFTALN